MNNLIKYMGLYIIGIIGLLTSCAAEAERSDESVYDATESAVALNESSNLEDDYLSENNIIAFEQRAIQKLEDLKDYFEILSDSTLDDEFKKQAALMAIELFSEKENTISFSLDKVNSNDEQNIESFLLELQNGTMGMLSVKIQNISLIEKIIKSNNHTYQGTIRLGLSITSNKAQSHIKNSKVLLECEVVAKKVAKEFGKTTKMVWEVFLGDIYQQ